MQPHPIPKIVQDIRPPLQLILRHLQNLPSVDQNLYRRTLIRDILEIVSPKFQPSRHLLPHLSYPQLDAQSHSKVEPETSTSAERDNHLNQVEPQSTLHFEGKKAQALVQYSDLLKNPGRLTKTALPSYSVFRQARQSYSIWSQS